MRFGAFVPQGWRLDLMRVGHGRSAWQAMVGVAQRLEALGYESLWLFDHFHTIPDARVEDTFECWTSTAALAQVTSHIRLGQLVGCNLYRQPSVLAKMASTIDVLSNGRLEFGLGAGWYEHETIAYGFPFEKPAVRINQLDEALRIIKGMWTHDRFQFEGQYYRVGIGPVKDFRGRPMMLDGALNHPRPLQHPHPPIWVGGGGEQLTLRTVARHADYSNYFGLTVDAVAKKNAILDEHCHQQGRDPAAVKRSLSLEVMYGSLDDMRALNAERGFSPEEVERRSQAALRGPSQHIIDKLAQYAGQRIEYFIAYFPDAAYGDSMQRFAEEVVPALRGAVPSGAR